MYHSKSAMNVLPKHSIYPPDASLGMYESIFWFHEWFLYVFIFAGLYVKQIDHIIWISWSYSNLIIME